MPFLMPSSSETVHRLHLTLIPMNATLFPLLEEAAAPLLPSSSAACAPSFVLWFWVRNICLAPAPAPSLFGSASLASTAAASSSGSSIFGAASSGSSLFSTPSFGGTSSATTPFGAKPSAAMTPFGRASSASPSLFRGASSASLYLTLVGPPTPSAQRALFLANPH
ncbi:hypothetical protein HN51_066204, partial [Arachis hypogaea]